MRAPRNERAWRSCLFAGTVRGAIAAGAAVAALVVCLALAPVCPAGVYVPDKMPSVVVDLRTNQVVPLKDVMTLSSSLPAIGMTGVQQKYPYITGSTGWGATGKDYQTIAIIDTGIDYTHPALASRYLGGYDFGSGDSDPMDTQGHGTHVAGIAVSTNATYPGVAPGAKVVALKVYNDQTKGIDESSIVSALGWVVDHAAQYHITAVNLSLGDGGSYTASDIGLFYNPLNPTLVQQEDHLRTLKSMGIFVAASAGNDGYLHGLSYPAASPSIVSVGGTWASNDYNNTAFGWEDPTDWNVGNGPVPSLMVDWGPKQNNIMVVSDRYSTANDGRLDLFAPGAIITSTYPMSLDTQDNARDGLTEMMGTSMASPQVAAASMLVRQALVMKGLLDPDPAKQVDQILQILKDTGKDLLDSSSLVITEGGPAAGNNRNLVLAPSDGVMNLYGDLYVRPGTNATYPLIDMDAAISQINPVPEPATMGLLACGALGMLLRRRKRS